MVLEWYREIILKKYFTYLFLKVFRPELAEFLIMVHIPFKGVALFNPLPIYLRNSDHGDTAMFKNHLDIYLANIPDQPTVAGLARGAQSNSLLHQIPMYELSLI